MWGSQRWEIVRLRGWRFTVEGLGGSYGFAWGASQHRTQRVSGACRAREQKNAGGLERSASGEIDRQGASHGDADTASDREPAKDSHGEDDDGLAQRVSDQNPTRGSESRGDR